jgi:hypothetical protein
MNDPSATCSEFEKKRDKVEQTLTDEEIDNLLEDYVEINDPLQIEIDSHVRYFTIAFEKGKAKKVFRLGGKLFSISPDGDYLVLKHGNNVIQAYTKQSIFYKHLSIGEIKSEYEEILDKYEDEILDLKRLNKKLYTELTGKDTRMKGGRHARLQKLELSIVKHGDSDDENDESDADESDEEPLTYTIGKGIQNKVNKVQVVTKTPKKSIIKKSSDSVSNTSSCRSAMSSKKSSTMVPPSKLELLLGKHIRL